MPLISTPAIVLQAFAYSETSKILRLLTPEHGVVSAIAKGAQRPKSRFGGLLDVFTEGHALLYMKPGRELQTMSGFDLVRSRQVVGRDLGAFAGASLLAELVLRAGTTESQPSLYRAVARGLDRIAEAERERIGRTALSEVWQIIAHLGFQPGLDRCVSCGNPLAEAEAARFDVEAGGVACTLCRPHGRPFDARSRAELAGMLAGRELTEALGNASLQRALLQAFVGVHLAGSHDLRSLTLFLQQLD